MTTPQPDTQYWYQSSQIRMALLLFVPLGVRFARRLGWFDLTSIGTDILVDWSTACLAAVSGVWWMVKRVRAGKDPKSSAPEIITPPVVTNVINRLTKE